MMYGGGDAPVQRIEWVGGGMALHSKEGLRWELPIGQNLAIVPAIKLIIGAKHFDVCGDGKGLKTFHPTCTI